MYCEIEKSTANILKSLSGVKREPFENYTKFFGGNLELEHLDPPYTHNI